MSDKYILGIDQSTQSTKALLFDSKGKILGRSDICHNQIINDKGWVEHDPMQIYDNTITVARNVIEKAAINKSDIIGIGLTNQRETAVVWDRETGLPLYNAIVWQCARGAGICERLINKSALIHKKTGLNLSPYFSAAKIAWIIENVEQAKDKSEAGTLAYGTMDSWLLYKLSDGKRFKTDYSNASRTQLFNIRELKWDDEICNLFGINKACLAEVCDSNSNFGDTDLEGLFDMPIPIHSILGDSHGALFGQECHKKGMAKATYGTGSSIMMNIGEEAIFSEKGIVTSLAWGIDGQVSYVLEGNINYTGAVISWLKNDLGLIQSETETEALSYEANPSDKTCLVPAFSGLGAPYWDSKARAIISGMTRTTGKAEIVRAALESIAYQINDIISVMIKESGIRIKELRVDGGPTRNKFLMQFQSDILNSIIHVPDVEELSVVGASYMAGIAMGLFDEKVFKGLDYNSFNPLMLNKDRMEKCENWKRAIDTVLYKS
ncbi:MAG: glycerol kinase GlpK [Anaerolineaceae bacterium]|nr:MAG: glycerol kinase GlpK [Anaerolineaceae bacterium]